MSGGGRLTKITADLPRCLQPQVAAGKAVPWCHGGDLLGSYRPGIKNKNKTREEESGTHCARFVGGTAARTVGKGTGLLVLAGTKTH